MLVDVEMEENNIFVPEDVLCDAKNALSSLIPNRSASVYEKEYTFFCEWRIVMNLGENKHFYQ